MAKKKPVRLNRTELEKQLAADLGLSRQQMNAIMGAAFGLIAQTIHAGEPVTIRGFGRFFPRIGGGFERNGVKVPRRRRIAFTPALNQRFEVK